MSVPSYQAAPTRKLKIGPRGLISLHRAGYKDTVAGLAPMIELTR